MSGSDGNAYAEAMAINQQAMQRRAAMAQRLMQGQAPAQMPAQAGQSIGAGGDVAMGGAAAVPGLSMRDIQSSFAADTAKREATARATGQPVEASFFSKLGDKIGGWFGM